jgi:hypothetical protein
MTAWRACHTHITCKTQDGRQSVGDLPSGLGPEIQCSVATYNASDSIMQCRDESRSSIKYSISCPIHNHVRVSLWEGSVLVFVPVFLFIFVHGDSEAQSLQPRSRTAAEQRVYFLFLGIFS